MSKPALKRKQTRRTALTASLEESIPPPSTPEDQQRQQPEDEGCWEHDMPSDDDVFTPPKKKKAPRAIVYDEEDEEVTGDTEEVESDSSDPPPKRPVQRKTPVTKPWGTPYVRGGVASRPGSPRPASSAASSTAPRPSTLPRPSTPVRTSSPARPSASDQGGSPVGASSPSPRSRPRSNLFSASPQQTEPMIRGPKKGADVLCWLEPEFIRRGVPKPYRKCVLVDADFIGEPLISIYTVLRIETAGDPEDENSVLWQPIKKGGSVLTVNQWNILCDNMEAINSTIEKLADDNA